VSTCWKPYIRGITQIYFSTSFSLENQKVKMRTLRCFVFFSFLMVACTGESTTEEFPIGTETVRENPSTTRLFYSTWNTTSNPWYRRYRSSTKAPEAANRNWYSTTSPWYYRTTSRPWYYRSTSRPWYYYRTTSNPWYYRYSYQTTSSPQLFRCSNFRDVSKDFPENGDLSCQVDSSLYGSGGGSYYSYYNANNKLLLRETIIRYPQSNTGTYPIKYYKTIPEHVTKVDVLNFGEVHAFVRSISIQIRSGNSVVAVEILQPPMKEVKLFVEIYGDK
jgi:hypothetical protein